MILTRVVGAGERDRGLACVVGDLLARKRGNPQQRLPGFFEPVGDLGDRLAPIRGELFVVFDRPVRQSRAQLRRLLAEIGHPQPLDPLALHLPLEVDHERAVADRVRHPAGVDPGEHLRRERLGADRRPVLGVPRITHEPRRLPAFSTPRSASARSERDVKSASTSSISKLGEYASIAWKSAASVIDAARIGERQASSSTSSSLVFPERFCGDFT